MVDTFSRYAPVLDPRFSYRGRDMIATLKRVCSRIGYTKTIRVDQGSEFTSRDMDLWAYQRGVSLDVRRLLGLAFLAPDLTAAILDGRQPIGLTAERLTNLPARPIAWTDQRSLFDGA